MRQQVPVADESAEEGDRAPTKLAIGVEGGFNTGATEGGRGGRWRGMKGQTLQLGVAVESRGEPWRAVPSPSEPSRDSRYTQSN